MISKNLIRIIGLLTIIGPILFLFYQGVVIILSEFTDQSTEIQESVWLNSILLLAIVILLIALAGLYFLLSSALKNAGLMGLSLIYLGYIIIAGTGYAKLAGLSAANHESTLGNTLPPVILIIAYGSASIGFMILGLLLRKHKLFKPAIAISIAIGGLVFFGSNFARESSLLVEVVGMIFLFVMGLIPAGWQVYKMYQKE